MERVEETLMISMHGVHERARSSRASKHKKTAQKVAVEALIANCLYCTLRFVVTKKSKTINASSVNSVYKKLFESENEVQQLKS